MNWFNLDNCDMEPMHGDRDSSTKLELGLGIPMTHGYPFNLIILFMLHIQCH